MQWAIFQSYEIHSFVIPPSPLIGIVWNGLSKARGGRGPVTPPPRFLRPLEDTLFSPWMSYLEGFPFGIVISWTSSTYFWSILTYLRQSNWNVDKCRKYIFRAHSNLFYSVSLNIISYTKATQIMLIVHNQWARTVIQELEGYFSFRIVCL